MTVEKLERVMWRVRKQHPNTNMIPYNSMRLAIMKEIGVCQRTIQNNIKALKRLGWIKVHSRHKYLLTNEDL